jgi:hypothetical protein
VHGSATQHVEGRCKRSHREASCGGCVPVQLNCSSASHDAGIPLLRRVMCRVERMASQALWQTTPGHTRHNATGSAVSCRAGEWAGRHLRRRKLWHDAVLALQDQRSLEAGQPQAANVDGHPHRVKRSDGGGGAGGRSDQGEAGHAGDGLRSRLAPAPQHSALRGGGGAASVLLHNAGVCGCVRAKRRHAGAIPPPRQNGRCIMWRGMLKTASGGILDVHQPAQQPPRDLVTLNITIRNRGHTSAPRPHIHTRPASDGCIPCLAA